MEAANYRLATLEWAAAMEPAALIDPWLDLRIVWPEIPFLRALLPLLVFRAARLAACEDDACPGLTTVVVATPPRFCAFVLGRRLPPEAAAVAARLLWRHGADVG